MFSVNALLNLPSPHHLCSLLYPLYFRDGPTLFKMAGSHLQLYHFLSSNDSTFFSSISCSCPLPLSVLFHSSTSCLLSLGDLVICRANDMLLVSLWLHNTEVKAPGLEMYSSICVFSHSFTNARWRFQTLVSRQDVLDCLPTSYQCWPSLCSLLAKEE